MIRRSFPLSVFRRIGRDRRSLTRRRWPVMAAAVAFAVFAGSYQLASTSTPARFTRDPENRLHWRHAPRRLSTEEIRDELARPANGRTAAWLALTQALFACAEFRYVR